MDIIFTNIKAFLEEPWLNSACLIIGSIWALFLFRSSNRRECDNNELLNQPRFKFFDSMNTHKEIKRSCDIPECQMRPLPDYCDNPECDRIHWFDIKNDGNFPADCITISMALEGENSFKTKIKERRMEVKHLQAQESLQFSTSFNSIRDSFYEKKKIGDNFRFYVFVQYKSGYSKYWYKRIYQIDANKISRNNLPEIRIGKRYEKSAWVRGVEFFGMCEKDCKCQKDVSFIKKLKFHSESNRKDISLSQYANIWASDLFGTCILERFLDFIIRKTSKLCKLIKSRIHQRKDG